MAHEVQSDSDLLWIVKAMDALLGVVLTILPIVVALLMLLVLHKAADTTGVVVWLLTLIIAIFAFTTDPGVALLASLAGVVRSFPISLMVLTSIFMITYMQETGSLQRITVFFKTVGGGDRVVQIMMISLGLGLFLVGMGATPVSMLPPVMLALGFSPMAAVALPAIGYDPLTTFALLGVPAVVFTDVYNGFASTPVQLWEAGTIFARFMPVVTTGIALGMLWIGGGKELLKKREGVFLAILCGVTAGIVAIVSNSENVRLTTLTNVFAGAAVMGVLYVYTRLRGRRMIDRKALAEEDLKHERRMSLTRASIPWVILIVLGLATNIVEPVRDFLFRDLAYPIAFGQFPPISTRPLWQAYTLVLVATLAAVPFLRHDRVTIRKTVSKFLKRAPRPVLAAAIFFAMAEVMNYSGWIPHAGGAWGPPLDSSNNMISLLAGVTSATFGVAYPLTAAFFGLLGGFVSGSETSAIAMFTRYHYDTSVAIAASPVVVSASNGIGGGLASVLSPAKIQNAAAVIDNIGIEGEVIRCGFVIAILMTLVTAMLTMIWAFA